jgi:hypothetical protein
MFHDRPLPSLLFELIYRSLLTVTLSKPVDQVNCDDINVLKVLGFGEIACLVIHRWAI